MAMRLRVAHTITLCTVQYRVQYSTRLALGGILTHGRRRLGWRASVARLYGVKLFLFFFFFPALPSKGHRRPGHSKFFLCGGASVVAKAYNVVKDTFSSAGLTVIC